MDSEEVSDQESILSEDDNRNISAAANDLENQEMASEGEEESKEEAAVVDAGLGDAQVSQAAESSKSKASKRSSKSVTKGADEKKDKKSKKDRSESSRQISKKDRIASQSVGAKSESSKHKKGKKDKKRKDKNKKKGKGGKKHKKKKKGSDSSSSSNSDTSDASSDWSLNDGNVDYGSPERISDASDQWEGRSAELYDSDNAPDFPLNAYHIQSKPRCVVLEDFDDNGDIVQLQLDCMEIRQDEEMKQMKELDNLQLSYHDKKKKEELDRQVVDHAKYQNRDRYGEPGFIALHNMISPDFIKGVQKNLTCPICQEMVTNPVIYKSCLHRFCSNCIETYNR